MKKFRSWGQLETVLTVAQEGSYRAAAQKLGVTSSTVARHIESITDEIGQQIFLPAGNKWVLTKVGQELVDIASGAQTELGFMLRGLENVEGERLTVKINTVSFLISDYLAPALPSWYEANPCARLIIEADDRKAAIERGAADVALRLTRPDTMGGSRFKLANCPVGLYQLPGHEKEGWIGLPEDYDIIPEMRLAKGHFGSEPHLRLATFRAIAQAALSTGMAGILPTCMARQHPQLQPVLNRSGRHIKSRRELWFLFYGLRKYDPGIMAAKDWVKKVFPSPNRCLCGKCETE